MDTSSEVYSNIERKRELVTGLKDILAAQLGAAEALDAKGWEILKVTSATFGLVSALEITLTTGTVGKYFWAILGGVMILYLLQVIAVMLAVRPLKWHFVPGGADGITRYDTLLKKYVPLDDSAYLDQLIVDYAGMKDPKKKGATIPGAISVAQANNRLKARWITVAAILLALIIVGLIFMAIAAVRT